MWYTQISQSQFSFLALCVVVWACPGGATIVSSCWERVECRRGSLYEQLTTPLPGSQWVIPQQIIHLAQFSALPRQYCLSITGYAKSVCKSIGCIKRGQKWFDPLMMISILLCSPFYPGLLHHHIYTIQLVRFHVLSYGNERKSFVRKSLLGKPQGFRLWGTRHNVRLVMGLVHLGACEMESYDTVQSDSKTKLTLFTPRAWNGRDSHLPKVWGENGEQWPITSSENILSRGAK